jgi:hypothetical protein
MMKNLIFICLILLFVHAKGQEGWAIAGIDALPIHPSDSSEQEVIGSIPFLSLFEVMERSDTYDKDPDVNSEGYDKVFRYKVRFGDIQGWVKGYGVFHLDTAYDHRSAYTNVYEENEFIPYSLHEARKHVFRVTETVEYEPFSGDRYVHLTQSIIPWWGYGFFMAMRHPDGDPKVIGNEEIIPVFSKLPIKDFDSRYETDMLQIVSVWDISHLMHRTDGQFIISYSTSDGNRHGSLGILQISRGENGFIAEDLFSISTKAQ